MAEGIITIARSRHVKYPTMFFYVYIYMTQIGTLIYQKIVCNKRQKKSKNNMHRNFASTRTMNFVVADADLVL